VRQEGSNITSERLRFDFSHPQALTVTEMKQVESLINQKIKADLKVVKTIEDKNKALASGAMAFFRENYPDKVSVYTIGDFSKELCGGPHVNSTGSIGDVKLIKQEAIGAGKRRVYAVLNYGTKKSTGKIHHQRSSG
jgi:alanyl-tRNA synthetase